MNTIRSFQTRRMPWTAILWALAVALWLRPAGAQSLNIATQISVESQTAGSLHTVNFQTSPGSIHVNLPADTAAWDQIYYSIATQPAGATPEEQTRNQYLLDRFVVNVAGTRTPVFQNYGTATVPAGGLNFPVALEDAGGRTLVIDYIPITDPNASIETFVLPEIGQAGSTIDVVGPLSPGAGTELKIGGQDAVILAKSPRKLVAQSPANIIGPTTIELNDGGVSHSSPFRNLVVQTYLSSDTLGKDDMGLGTAYVYGLGGLQQPLDLRLLLNPLGAAHMDGGDAQEVTVRPRDVLPGGMFAVSRRITGVELAQLTLQAVPVGLAPEFTCCEEDLKIKKIQAIPQNTTRRRGVTTVTVDFKLDLEWFCKQVRNQDCLAFYNVSIAESSWQEFDAASARWVEVPRASVRETITPAPPIKARCDGRAHSGTWGFRYQAQIDSLNQLRNVKLVFDFGIPAAKGKSYTVEVKITDVSGTTKPDVEILRVDEKVTQPSEPQAPPREQGQPQGGAQQQPTQPPPPQFTCCEADIHIKKATATPHNNTRRRGVTTVTVDFKFDIEWFCNLVEKRQDCLAFYNVSIAESNWQEFDLFSRWVPVPAASVRETITPAPPLKERCDGKTHTGTWGFRYQASIDSLNQLRNVKLVFKLEIPAAKGASYTVEVKITDVSGTTKPKVEFAGNGVESQQQAERRQGQQPGQQQEPPAAGPKFTCCEEQIQIYSEPITVKPQVTAVAGGVTTVTADFELDLYWFCNLVEKPQDCLAFYAVSLEQAAWKEWFGGEWRRLDPSKVKETITPGAPLKATCDGKAHTGKWTFRYQAVIQSANPLEKPRFSIYLDVPAKKGKKHLLHVRISDVLGGVQPTFEVLRVLTGN